MPPVTVGRVSVDVSGYLRRLGVPEAGGPPDIAALRLLHRAHVERVPYENLQIALGRPTTVDPAESARRIIRGRGGYCYHLNGAFSLLLATLGYRVSRHVGGVQGTTADPAGADGKHLALTVSGLPTPENPHGRWFVDVGLGDALHEPLPLVPGGYRQGPFEYGMRPSEAEPGGWRFDHAPGASFLGMDFRPEAVEMAVFADNHRWLSTSPESHFVRTVTVQRRDADGVDLLRGLVLSRIGTTRRREILETPRDYFTALADVFGLVLDDVGPAERAALWDRLQADHERRLAEHAEPTGPPQAATDSLVRS